VILPWQVDVPQDNRPVANWLIVLACVAVFVLQMVEVTQQVAGGQATGAHDASYGTLDTWVLDGWSLKGLLGYMWLHGGFIHLLGNMWFLWVFGNAVCANVGNLRYPLVYVTLGVAAGIAFLLVTPGSVVGASGAINGVVGMYLVMFPQNEITCYFFFWLFIPYIRQFAVSGYWLILFWLFWDILGAVRSGDSGVAYFAHLGGFGAGVGLGILFCLKGWCLLDEYDRSLVQIWQDRKKQKDEASFASELSQREFIPKEPPVPEATAEPKPAEPKRLSVPMLDLNDGRTIPETSAGLRCLCGEWITVSNRYAGKVVRCPQCKAPVQIPGDVASDSTDRPRPKPVRAKTKPKAEMIRFACPCGQKIKIPARYGGRRGKCPHCGARLRIPLPTRRSH